MTRQEMIKQILNSPTAKAQGVEMIKEMIDRHDDQYLAWMFGQLVESEDHLMYS